MGLTKTITNPKTGAPVSYWEPIAYAVDLRAGIVKVTLGGYYSREAREGGMEPIMPAHFEMPLAADLAALSASALDMVRSMPEFVDAVPDPLPDPPQDQQQ
jgi:hypothetical protein